MSKNPKRCPKEDYFQYVNQLVVISIKGWVMLLTILEQEQEQEQERDRNQDRTKDKSGIIFHSLKVSGLK